MQDDVGRMNKVMDETVDKDAWISFPEDSGRGVRKLLTIAEVSAVLRLGRPAVVDMLKRGDLRGFRAGKRQWRVSAASLDSLINAG